MSPKQKNEDWALCCTWRSVWKTPSCSESTLSPLKLLQCVVQRDGPLTHPQPMSTYFVHCRQMEITTEALFKQVLVSNHRRGLPAYRDSRNRPRQYGGYTIIHQIYLFFWGTLTHLMPVTHSTITFGDETMFGFLLSARCRRTCGKFVRASSVECNVMGHSPTATANVKVLHSHAVRFEGGKKENLLCRSGDVIFSFLLVHEASNKANNTKA